MRRAVTLIELLVTMTIIAIISAAVLGTAAAAIESGRSRKTISTVEKISGLIQEKLATFETRRVDLNQATMNAIAGLPTQALQGKAKADVRLLGMRELMKMEMPDRWSDVREPQQILLNRPGLSATYYARLMSSTPTDLHAGAECLYLTVMYATGEGEARSLFTSQEVGDVDGDGAKEFIDGWGNPISWLRWPAGYAPSRIMSGDADADHDPFDMYSRDIPKAGRLTDHFPKPTSPAYPPAVTAALNSMQARDGGAFRLVPLIWSTGPDGEQQVNSGPDGFIADADPFSVAELGADGVMIGAVRPVRAPDDVTNHSVDY